MATKQTGSRSFNAFTGVFVPTFLTIIGVILFLRLGRIVGEAGIIGSIAIVLVAVSITIATGLSLSSITTTLRIGSGGAFSIISKTLGLEVGGSVGIPLYLAQTFSVVLYVFGFSEAWQFIFPQHPRLIILLGTFLLLFLLTFISVRFAIRAQLLVFSLVILSLVSVFAGGNWWNYVLTIPPLGNFSTASFWLLFALFFPAVTGLMAGVGLSGELTNPKKQIPKGVIAALGVTTLIYILMILWYSYSATPKELLADNLLIVKLAANSGIVLVGILAATFSSALTTLVAAPRLLQSLAENSILFFNNFFAQKSSSGEPRNATLFTAFIVLIFLLASSLDAIAPVLTVVFLISYAMINLVVYIEQSLGFVSFRPTFKIPKLVPLYGVISSVIVMFYINIIAGLFALAGLFLVYLLLVRKRLEVKTGYVRSGLLLAVSEWAAKKVRQLAESEQHVWKPNMLFPTLYSRTLLGNFPLIRAITYPNGGLSVLGINIKKAKTVHGKKVNKEQLQREKTVLPQLVEKFGREGIFTTYAYVEAPEYVEAITISLEALEGQFFHPNILFIPVAPQYLTKTGLKKIFNAVNNSNAGLMMFDKDKDVGLGSQEDIHVWIPKEAMIEDIYTDKNYDLAMLAAYQLYRNWVGKINIWMSVDKKNKDEAQRFLKKLVYEARFPASTEINIVTDSFAKTIRANPRGDLHIIPIYKLSQLVKTVRTTKDLRTSFLFVVDSTHEDVLA